MKAIRIKTVIQKDGEIHITGLPYRRGENADVICIIRDDAENQPLTAERLAASDLVGIWANRRDIQDSEAYARLLRERAQRRVFE